MGRQAKIRDTQGYRKDALYLSRLMSAIERDELAEDAWADEVLSSLQLSVGLLLARIQKTNGNAHGKEKAAPGERTRRRI